jgi:ATP-dependent Clp protease ATP-binding subunit ClpA
MRFIDVSYPYHVFRFQYLSGEEALVPFFGEDFVQEGGDAGELAIHMQSFIQEYIDEFGSLDFMLEEFSVGDFTQLEEEATIFITTVSQSRLGIPLRFQAYHRTQGNMHFAYIPLPHGNVLATTLNELKRRMHLFVALNFMGLSAEECVDKLIEILWVQQISREQLSIEVRIPHPSETKVQAEKVEPVLLSKAAPMYAIQEVPFFERSFELLRLTRALRSTKSRLILLVGSQGVGKSALVNECIRRLFMERGESSTIRETSAALLMQSLQNNLMGWQQGLAMLLRELQHHPCTLYVRSYADLFEVGTYQGNSISIGQYLRPYMERGEISLLTECTPEQKARLESQHPSILKQFQVIHLEEQDVSTLEGIIEKYVAHTGHHIAPVAIRTLLSLQMRFTPFAGYPGKTLRTLERLLQRHESAFTGSNSTISETQVLEFFSMETGLPSFLVNRHIPMNQERIEEFFRSRIYGQEPVIQSMTSVLAKIKTGLSRGQKPIASLLLTGSTGVGKTAAAKALAEQVFGDAGRLIRFDMSEYSTSWQVQTLIGSPYQADSEGKLTTAVRRQPFAVVLFDEIEKAESSFFDLLLQILDEGRLTDQSGRLTSFCGAIILLTTNIGTQRLRIKPVKLGKQKTAEAQYSIEDLIKAAGQVLRPELVNRFDEIIHFQALTQEIVELIVSRELSMLRQREGLQNRPFELSIEPAVASWLSEKGYHPDYGARYLQRAIREHVVLPLAEALNQFDPADMLNISLRIQNQTLQVHVEEHEDSGDYLMAEYDRLIQTNFANHLQRSVHQFRESSTGIAFMEGDHDELTGQLVQLTESLNELAEKLSIGFLRRLPITEGAYDELLSKKELLRELKYNAFAATTDDFAHSCTLMLVGHDVQYIQRVYEFILKSKSYTYSIQQMDLQDNRHPELKLVEGTKPVTVPAGVILEIFGNLSDLYFAQEEGKHEITKPDGRRTYVQVIVKESAYLPNTAFILATLQARMKNGQKVVRELGESGQLRYYEGSKRKSVKIPGAYEEWLLHQLDTWIEARIELLSSLT